MIHRLFLAVLSLLTLYAPNAAAQAQMLAGGKPAKPAPPIVVTIGPAADPVPALRYTLLPPDKLLIHGNAAPIYLRQVFETRDAWRNGISNGDKYLRDKDDYTVPLDELPLDEMREYFSPYERLLSELWAAARRDDCQWEYTLESQEPEQVLLPDMQFMRAYARLLAARARFDIREGRLDDALQTMQAGFALAKNTGKAPFLISALVGMAIADMHRDCVIDFIQQSGATNLYWALAQLPNPLIPLEPALRTEGRFLEMKFQELEHVDYIDSPQAWERLAQSMRREFRETMVQIWQPPHDNEVLQRFDRTLNREVTPEFISMARDYLVRVGPCSEAAAAKMSQPELQVRYTKALWQELTDAIRRWMFLPYPQAYAKAVAENERLKTEAQQREWLPFVDVYLPALTAVMKAETHARRATARLQVIEALRMHLAAGDGMLPARLEDVAVVPIPLDPATGGPFAYRLEGAEALLDVTDAAGLHQTPMIFPTRIRLHEKRP